MSKILIISIGIPVAVISCILFWVLVLPLRTPMILCPSMYPASDDTNIRLFIVDDTTKSPIPCADIDVTRDPDIKSGSRDPWDVIRRTRTARDGSILVGRKLITNEWCNFATGELDCAATNDERRYGFMIDGYRVNNSLTYEDLVGGENVVSMKEF